MRLLGSAAPKVDRFLREDLRADLFCPSCFVTLISIIPSEFSTSGVWFMFRTLSKVYSSSLGEKFDNLKS